MGEYGGKVVDVLLFPGQGSQRVGMGRDLAERFPAARDVFERVDAALGIELTRIMWDGPDRELTLTHNAQPAILAHSMAVHAIVRERLSPNFGVGHSLGEYSAYCAAGTLSIEDAARIVRRRGELMLEAGNDRPGAMAACIALASDQVEKICSESSTEGDVVVAANFNGPDQTVISGDPSAVERASEALKAAGAKRVLPLKVSGAFHSPLMQPARESLEAALSELDMKDPEFKIVVNATAGEVSEAGEARRMLGEQLVSPVRWVASMEHLNSQTDSKSRFIEMGPGNVLAGLMKRIAKRPVMSLGSAEEVAAFLEQRER